MLDFQKLSAEIPSLAAHVASEREKSATARVALQKALSAHTELRQTFVLPTVPGTYTVIATDGSQIDLERHQGIACYVINVGSVVIRYGDKPDAQLTSEAHVFYRDGDIYVGSGSNRRMVQVADIAARRDIEEMRTAAECARTISKPAIVMMDGTLIRWTIEHFDEASKQKLLADFLDALDTCRAAGVPVCSYISAPASRDITAMLDKEESVFVTDAMLFSGVMPEGERSVVLPSNSDIVKLYGPHAVHYCYINVGSEVARIEIPAWVAEDKAMLDMVHAVSVRQANLGKGYPVALLEAHEQAVVTARDRETFFALIGQELSGTPYRLQITEKALAKRVRLV